MHPGSGGRRGFEHDGLGGFACHAPHPEIERLFAGPPAIGTGEKRRHGIVRWRRVTALVLLADGLGGARVQHFRPHFSEQPVRYIDFGAVDLAIDGEHVADDVIALLAGRFRRGDIGVPRLGQFLVFERSCRLLAEAGALMSTPVTALSFCCSRLMPSQTFCWRSPVSRAPEPHVVDAGARIASFISREETVTADVENVRTSSPARADQRPCSTQNEAIGMRPDFGGSNRLTVSVRSCCPPFTISPAWTKTSRSPRFSISSELTLPVSRTFTTPLAMASASVSGTVPDFEAPWTK